MAGGNYDRSQKKGQLNPAVSYCFGLQVEAAFFVPVRSVRVFTRENEFDYYQEGGLNDYVHMLRKPISKPFTFQVERYVGVDSGMFDVNSGFLDPLALGTDLILPVILFVNRAQTANAGENFSFTNCARAYIFTGCTVTAKEYGELNAETSKLLTETTTIAYRELFTINQLDPSWERGGAWKFDTSSAKNYLGGGEAHTENRSKDTYTKQQGETSGNANQWIIDKDHPTGGGKDHTANRAKGNPDKAAGSRAGAHNKWAFPGSKDASMSTDHKSNRSNNDPKSKGEGDGNDKRWQISKDAFDGNKKFHTDERGRKNDPKSKGESDGNSNKWIWTGDYKGSGKSHTQNRSQNTKPEPVIWPPTRRALMAQALSDM
ncbi:MAG: hypothetical protein IJT24_06445 [Lachnospiraceae bacterium]|nr:hypothetical protein [Lachnospiraceae bacterium]